MGTLDVLTLLQVSLQVHFEEGRAAGVVGAAHGPVITAALMIPVHGEKQKKQGKISNKQKLMGTTDHQERSKPAL